MNLIDFDAHFTLYLRGWMAAHEDDFKDPDDMELAVPEVYAAFLGSPAEWLQGAKPGEYFDSWAEPETLVGLLRDYVKQRVSVPDMLLNRISALGEGAAYALLPLLEESGATAELQMLAIGLLREIGSPLPMQRYIDWQAERRLEDELADNALDSLEQMGEKAYPAMLEALEGATAAGKEALLSVLSRGSRDARVLEGLLGLFDACSERRAVLAAYLGRLRDEGALPALMAAAQEEQLRYLDYIEIRSAIEALGGEAPEREFYADAEYEALFPTRS